MPVPNWPLVLIELYEESGFIDDGFRTGWSAIAMANEPTDKHLWTTWDIIGDVAELYVKESASSEGAGYRKDISAKALLTNTYPILRARLKGSDTQPYYKIRVVYTDDSSTDTGWISAATNAYFIKSVDLTAAKTIKYIEIYAKSGGGSGAEAKVWWDYVAILKTNPFIPTAIEELDIDLQSTVAVSGFKFKLLKESGVTYPGVGAIAMIYLAAEGESLDQKLVKGRISQRERSGEPDNPLIEFIGRDMGDYLQYRTFTQEYATLTQPSQIVKDIIDAELPELTRNSVDDTNNSIKNKFKEANVFGLLKELGETGQFASGEKGADFWVDPGDDLRFKKLGSYSCPHRISDGSDGYAKNIKSIVVRELLDEVYNYIKLIIFEAEFSPRDEDSATENKADWATPDPQDAGSPTQDTGDVKSGQCCIKFNTTNPGSQFRMRVKFPSTDKQQYDKVKFWFKYGTGLSPENLEVRLSSEAYDAAGDWSSHWHKDSLSVPASETWYEYSINLSDFTYAWSGYPGNVITAIEIRAYRASGGLGAGGFKIDKLRFERSEKYKVSEDATSQGKYGMRKKPPVVDKTITDLDYAQYVVDGIKNSSKDPLSHIEVSIPGKAQPGYRPPQKTTVTSLKDEINQKEFRILRARHHIIKGDYTCELELLAAITSVGVYEPRVFPRIIAPIITPFQYQFTRATQTNLSLLRGKY